MSDYESPLAPDQKALLPIAVADVQLMKALLEHELAGSEELHAHSHEDPRFNRLGCISYSLETSHVLLEISVGQDMDDALCAQLLFSLNYRNPAPGEPVGTMFHIFRRAGSEKRTIHDRLCEEILSPIMRDFAKHFSRLESQGPRSAENPEKRAHRMLTVEQFEAIVREIGYMVRHSINQTPTSQKSLVTPSSSDE